MILLFVYGQLAEAGVDYHWNGGNIEWLCEAPEPGSVRAFELPAKELSSRSSWYPAPLQATLPEPEPEPTKFVSAAEAIAATPSAVPEPIEAEGSEPVEATEAPE